MEAPSVKSFERRLDKSWKNEDAKYDWECDLTTIIRHIHTNEDREDTDLTQEAEKPMYSEEDL